jgi:hypothetical protein
VENSDRAYFEILKTKITEVMRASHAGISQSIEDWKGNEIEKFQEDLENKVNAYISEKSFYNHFKSYNEKLPRIDVLNLLSRYAGYADWHEFRNRNSDKIIAVNEYKGSNKVLIWIPVLAIVAFSIAWLMIKAGNNKIYEFCLQDSDTRDLLPAGKVDVILPGIEQPLLLETDTSGRFTLKTGEDKMKIVPRMPYYNHDTINYTLVKNKEVNVIQVKADEYALMLHYFAISKVDSWQNRRNKLERLISDSAYICQVFRPKMTGMELYNKDEFIDMLTIPTGSLEKMTVLEVLYKKNKITTIKFSLDSRKE